MIEQECFLRLPAVIQQTGLSRSTLYARVDAGTFPAPTKISARAIAWPASTISKWIAETIAASKAVA